MENLYLKNYIKDFIDFIPPKGSKVLQINKNNYTSIFKNNFNQYDYIFLISILEIEQDILAFFEEVNKHLKDDGKLIVIYSNYLYAFLSGRQINWLSRYDVKTFLTLSNFDIILSQPFCFLPFFIPVASFLFNSILQYIFPFNHLGYFHYVSARKKSNAVKDISVSIIVPARNEAGTIPTLFENIPPLGTKTEIIFVEGHSKDDTLNVIKQCIKKYSSVLPFSYKLIIQKSSTGKASAVRLGFEKATGDVLIIYDADQTVKIQELKKFYFALINHIGDVVNGSRLIYPLQGKAMQFLNILGNKVFSMVYSWLLGQTIKDTLCGTKALWRKDYTHMKKDPVLFGQYDPFGDFDLLLGASKLQLKITDLPVRYYERQYGATNIKRFKNAWELARFSIIAYKYLRVRTSK